MTKKSIGLIIAFLIVGVLAIYAYLGGFHPIEISMADKQDYHFIGHYYEGKYDSDSLKQLFFKAKALILEESVAGTLAIANYAPNEENDTIHLFIGVLLNDPTIKDIPEKVERKIIKGGKIISANIKAHAAVRPVRTTVEEQMEAFAHEKGYTLKPLAIELYLAEDELQIDRIAE